MFCELSLVFLFVFIASSNALVGGLSSRRGQFPFFVYLEGGSIDMVYECGGALIDTNWVLTAAHCLRPVNQSIVLHFGLNEIDSIELGRTKRTVLPENFFLHPLFDPDLIKHDVALIRLPVPVKFNFYIQPIEIATYRTAFWPMEAILIGNGEHEYRGKRSNCTQYAPMKVTNIFDCFKSFPFLNELSTVFCASGINGESACYGDSGAPLIDAKERNLVGIASFIKTNGKCEDYPQVFTTIALYRKWILNTTGLKFMKCKKKN